MTFYCGSCSLVFRRPDLRRLSGNSLFRFGVWNETDTKFCPRLCKVALPTDHYNLVQIRIHCSGLWIFDFVKHDFSSQAEQWPTYHPVPQCLVAWEWESVSHAHQRVQKVKHVTHGRKDIKPPRARTCICPTGRVGATKTRTLTCSIPFQMLNSTNLIDCFYCAERYFL
jgi:hypothetical protein